MSVPDDNTKSGVRATNNGAAGGVGGPDTVWPATVVAVAVIGLVGVMFWRATEGNQFATIWAGVGSVVGLITGAIPSFFFARTANTATIAAQAAQQEAARVRVENKRAGDKIAAFYAATDDATRRLAMAHDPAAFRTD